MESLIARPWAQLPDDVIHRVLEKLCVDDCVACSTACKSWNRAVDSMVVALAPATQKVDSFVAVRFRKLRSLDLSGSLEAAGDTACCAGTEHRGLSALSSLQAIRWGCSHRDRALLPAPSPCYQIASNLPNMQTLISLDLPGPNETAMICDQAIQASDTWAPFFGQLRHLGMQCTSASTLAVCICLCFCLNLKSLSLSGGPLHSAIHALKQELAKCSAADMRHDAVAGTAAGLHTEDQPITRPTRARTQRSAQRMHSHHSIPAAGCAMPPGSVQSGGGRGDNSGGGGGGGCHTIRRPSNTGFSSVPVPYSAFVAAARSLEHCSASLHASLASCQTVTFSQKLLRHESSSVSSHSAARTSSSAAIDAVCPWAAVALRTAASGEQDRSCRAGNTPTTHNSATAADPRAAHPGHTMEASASENIPIVVLPSLVTMTTSDCVITFCTSPSSAIVNSSAETLMPPVATPVVPPVATAAGHSALEVDQSGDTRMCHVPQTVAPYAPCIALSHNLGVAAAAAHHANGRVCPVVLAPIIAEYIAVEFRSCKRQMLPEASEHITGPSSGATPMQQSCPTYMPHVRPIVPCPRLREIDAPHGILHIRSDLPLPYTKLHVKSLFLPAPTPTPPPPRGLAPLFCDGDPLGGPAPDPSASSFLCELRIPMSTSLAPSGSFPPGIHCHLTLLHLNHAEPNIVRWGSLVSAVLECPNLIDLDVSNCCTAPPPSEVAPGCTRDVNLFHYSFQGPDGHPHHNPPQAAVAAATANSHRSGASTAHVHGVHTQSPWPLRRFACDGSPGAMYLLLRMHWLRPVRELRHFSANGVQCVIGRLLALLTEQAHLATLSLLGSARCLSPPHETAVLATLPLLTTITSLALSPVPHGNAAAMAMALPAVLPRLRNLRRLQLPSALSAGVPAATAVLRSLHPLPLLDYLDISHASLSGAAVETLVACAPGVTELCLFGASDFTSSCVAALSQLGRLVALDISATSVNDAASSHLSQLTQITRINVSCNGCGVRSAEALAALPRLREVSMCGSPERRYGGDGTHANRVFGAGWEDGGGGADMGTTVGDNEEHLKVMALVPCMKLKRVVVPDKVLKDTRRSIESYGGHVPVWMRGGRSADSYPWNRGALQKPLL